MIRAVTHFFRKYITTSPENPDRISEHSLQIATAALLIEMMRADAETKEDERNAVMKTLQSRFHLSGGEIDEMLHGKSLAESL